MGCRCNDIERCRSDIDTVGQIKGMYGLLQYKNDEMDSKLSNMGTDSEQAVTPDNIVDLSRGIRQFNKELQDNADSMVLRCDSQLQALRRDLRSMISEDTTYHEELERERERD